ncbi:hypothetical protein PR048_003984 [Dryococelus australis]|uniref:Uncharacterized protein n=1 Tax=Dryococelus australis TaxID=614101 RepID=A0ABQ9I518_9NEOP|nr:hypothetical protein PR048_003984 [Dryococelus australis]
MHLAISLCLSSTLIRCVVFLRRRRNRTRQSSVVRQNSESSLEHDAIAPRRHFKPLLRSGVVRSLRMGRSPADVSRLDTVRDNTECSIALVYATPMEDVGIPRNQNCSVLRNNEELSGIHQHIRVLHANERCDGIPQRLYNTEFPPRCDLCRPEPSQRVWVSSRIWSLQHRITGNSSTSSPELTMRLLSNSSFNTIAIIVVEQLIHSDDRCRCCIMASPIICTPSEAGPLDAVCSSSEGGGVAGLQSAVHYHLPLPARSTVLNSSPRFQTPKGRQTAKRWGHHGDVKSALHAGDAGSLPRLEANILVNRFIASNSTPVVSDSAIGKEAVKYWNTGSAHSPARMRTLLHFPSTGRCSPEVAPAEQACSSAPLYSDSWIHFLLQAVHGGGGVINLRSRSPLMAHPHRGTCPPDSFFPFPISSYDGVWPDSPPPPFVTATGCRRGGEEQLYPAVCPALAMLTSCRTMPLAAGFLRDLPFPPPLHSVAAPYSPHFTLIGSQYLDVKSCANLTEVGGSEDPSRY